jgi:hypothetical protein
MSSPLGIFALTKKHGGVVTLTSAFNGVPGFLLLAQALSQHSYLRSWLISFCFSTGGIKFGFGIKTEPRHSRPLVQPREAARQEMSMLNLSEKGHCSRDKDVFVNCNKMDFMRLRNRSTNDAPGARFKIMICIQKLSTR